MVPTLWMNGARWPASVLLCREYTRHLLVFLVACGVIGSRPVGCSRLWTRSDVVGWIPCIMETVPWLHLQMSIRANWKLEVGVAQVERRCVAAGEATTHKRETPRQVKRARRKCSCWISKGKMKGPNSKMMTARVCEGGVDVGGKKGMESQNNISLHHLISDKKRESLQKARGWHMTCSGHATPTIKGEDK